MRRTVAVIGMLALAGCGGASNTTTVASAPPAAATDAPQTAAPVAAASVASLPASTLYVADRCNGRVSAFFALAHGNKKPGWTIEGSATQLVHPNAIAATADGIWVNNNSGGPGVVKFAADASGDVAPQVISAKPGSAQAVSVDADGRAIAPGMNGTIATFNADGSAASSIAGSATTANFPRAALTAADGTVYVANGTAQILVFAPNASGDVAPRATIAGSATGLKNPSALAFDPDGDLVVTDEANNSVLVFAPAASGNVAPLRAIVGAATGLNIPQGVAVARDGSIYVGNSSGKSVLVFAAGASGDAAPIRTLAGGKTGFTCPTGVALQ